MRRFSETGSQTLRTLGYHRAREHDVIQGVSNQLNRVRPILLGKIEGEGNYSIGQTIQAGEFDFF